MFSEIWYFTFTIFNISYFVLVVISFSLNYFFQELIEITRKRGKLIRDWQNGQHRLKKVPMPCKSYYSYNPLPPKERKIN